MTTDDETATLLRHDDLCARVWADKRLPPGTREIALAFAWAALRDPDRHTDNNGLRRVGHLLGRDDRGRWRHKLLIADDAPRYEESCGSWAERTCDGPRFRPYRSRDGLVRDDKTRCGANASTSVAEHDLVTGRLRRRHWFCARHRDHAERVQRQIGAAGEPPPPIPNRGGLLPCYFDGDWARLYRWATSDRVWEPPYYGLVADEWPNPEHEVIPRRPRLSLVVDVA